MQAKWLLALLPAICLCGPVSRGHAQQSSNDSAVSTTTGSIAGVLNDPIGAVVPRAQVEVKNLASGLTRSQQTSQTGAFLFDGMAAGHYSATIVVSGFEIVVVPDISVVAGREAKLNVTLRIAPLRTFIEVNAQEPEADSAMRRSVREADQAASRNSAELLEDTPGVSLHENGQLASIPFLHGLGDERTKLVVDGMTVSSACANHMNPPLSYAAPSHAAEVTVMAGITPVSLGGDSLGGTVTIDSPQQVFAVAGERLHEEGGATGFYRSNGQNYGGSLRDWVAGRNLGFGYTGSWATNNDYTDGSGHKVTSTYAQSTDHTVTLAAQGAGHLAVLQAGLHHTPYEGFVNAQMDMVRNFAESLNFHDRGNFAHGVLDTRVFWQNTWHSMNIGRDKSTFPMPMNMPMNTHGRDLGYAVKFDISLSARQTLRLGNELHRFVLDDRWPAVAGTAPYMGPDTFISIADGRRIRLGTFAELATKWNPHWTTLFGLRNDTVWTSAGRVQGYSGMYAADANAFNASNRAHTDLDMDATALVRYEPNAQGSFELGYARKTRAPNLYERYAWSTNRMASGMIGWFGDGNYYVGNGSLKPETAHTVSGTLLLRSRAAEAWQIKLTPYFTHIQKYVDVDAMMAYTPMGSMSTFAQLQFANHNASMHGADLSGNGTVWHSASLGQARLSGVGSWLHGERLDAETPLYQMMPVNARVALDEDLKGFTAGIEVQAADRKRNVDPHRYEQVTPGYTLFHLHAGYQRGHLQASAGADNLLNRNYELPLGGVNFDDFMASGWMSQINPLTGRGRSAYANLTVQF